MALEPNRKKKISDGLWPPSQLAICNGKLKYFKNPGHFFTPIPSLTGAVRLAAILVYRPISRVRLPHVVLSLNRLLTINVFVVIGKKVLFNNFLIINVHQEMGFHSRCK